MKRYLIASLLIIPLLLAQAQPVRAGGNDLFAPLVLLPLMVVAAVAIVVAGPPITTTKCSNNEWDCSGDQRKEAASFINVGGEKLVAQAAAGRGEYVNSLGSLMGCSPQAAGAFGRMTQRNFQRVFPERSDAEQSVSTLEDLIRADPELARQCSAAS